MNKKTKYKFVKLMISQLVMLCLLFTNIVSAATLNTIDGTIYAKLTKNNRLTNEIFQSNPNGYLTINNVENIEILINPHKKIATLSGDINTTLKGEINIVETTQNEGYVGFFEGKLSDGTYVLLDVTSTELESLVTLSTGYIGENKYEMAYFGIETNAIKDIDNFYCQDFIKKANNIESFENTTISKIEDNNVKSVANVDEDVYHQGGANIYSADGRVKVGELNLFFNNEISDGTSALLYAKLNTASGFGTYLKNYVYTDATEDISTHPDKFYIQLGTNHSKFMYNDESGSPDEDVDIANVPLIVPYIKGDTIKIFQYPLSITISEISVTDDIVSSNGILPDTVKWEIYKYQGWGNQSYVGDETSKQGMSVYGTWLFSGNVNTYLTTPVITKGKIVYLCSTYVNGRFRQYHFTTPEVTVSKNIKVIGD